MNELIELAETTMKADFAVMLIFFAFLGGIAIGMFIIPLALAIYQKVGINIGKEEVESQFSASQARGN